MLSNQFEIILGKIGFDLLSPLSIRNFQVLGQLSRVGALDDQFCAFVRRPPQGSPHLPTKIVNCEYYYVTVSTVPRYCSVLVPRMYFYAPIRDRADMKGTFFRLIAPLHRQKVHSQILLSSTHQAFGGMQYLTWRAAFQCFTAFQSLHARFNRESGEGLLSQNRRLPQCYISNECQGAFGRSPGVDFERGNVHGRTIISIQVLK